MSKCNCINIMGSICDECKSTMQLETLIKRANNGQDAIKELMRYHINNFDCRSTKTGEKHFRGVSNRYNHMPIFEFFIPTKLEPFTIGKDWIVKYYSNTEFMHIGCKIFNIKELKENLYALLNESQLTKEFFGSRSGITHVDENQNKFSISWEDTEKLYIAIKDL